jgi:signal transduction histidine kinase
MPEIAWYRSLYWRIALGFVALLAALLAVQGVVFLWITGRAAELLPGRTPGEYAQTIAGDLATVLRDQPDTDLDEYLNSRYQTTYRPFVVVTRERRIVNSRRIEPPPELARAAVGRLAAEIAPMYGPPRGGGGGAGPGTGISGPPPPPSFPRDPARGRPQLDPRGPNFGGRGPGPGRGRGPGPGPGTVFATVAVNGEIHAVVAVTAEPRPLSAVMRDLGPTLGIVAIALLATGASIGALLIFRPAHRRLRSLQDAVQAIGAGQTAARAPATGGDEVAMLSHAFNEMASGLEQRTQALVAADESRRQLLADVSHELMTPLAAIRGYAETMAMSDLNLDEATRQRYLRIVGDETERMEHIIGELLDLARLEVGAGTLKQEPVAVAALFERVLHRHDPILRSKGITLERRVAAGAEQVTGDANRLEHAIQNLAANAVRHTPDGGRIVLSAEPVSEGVRFSVEDNGPGIPADHLPKVFDRFYKVDGSRTGTEVASGSGLGLSIVQAIVKRHGGTIQAGNAPAGGARFDLVLPVVPARPA